MRIIIVCTWITAHAINRDAGNCSTAGKEVNVGCAALERRSGGVKCGRSSSDDGDGFVLQDSKIDQLRGVREMRFWQSRQCRRNKGTAATCHTICENDFPGCFDASITSYFKVQAKMPSAGSIRKSFVA
jgi:hypothetical protein